eukprot:g25122.t1
MKDLDVSPSDEPYLIRRIKTSVEDAYFRYKRTGKFQTTIENCIDVESMVVNLELDRVGFMKKISPSGLLYCVECQTALGDVISAALKDAPLVFIEQAVCAECTTKAALVRCQDCVELFCYDCFKMTHAAGTAMRSQPLEELACYLHESNNPRQRASPLRSLGAMAADQTALNAGNGEKVSREQILRAIASLLSSKDTAYIDAVKKRAADGNLKIKGIQISEETVSEALSQANSLSRPALESSSSGMRWTPSAASAACLANKAIEECEEAEGYNERVRVVGGSKLAILVKPDVASTQTGEYLAPDQWADTIARVVNRKDGRVYVRLRSLNGWVSSRSSKDYAKVVLQVEQAFLRASDGRAYLHLKAYRGWICERAKADFSKLAVQPSGSTEELIELEVKENMPSSSSVRTREGSRKVIVLEKTETVGEGAEQPGASASSAPDLPAKAMRLKLRRLFVRHGAKMKECEEERLKITIMWMMPSTSYIFMKEAQKAKKTWADAVKSLLKETPDEKLQEKSSTNSALHGSSRKSRVDRAEQIAAGEAMAETFVALGPDLRGQVSSATLPVTAPARAPAVLARGLRDPSSSNSSARCALSLLGLAALLSRGKTARAAKAKKQKKQVLKITEESFEEPDEDGIDACFFDHIQRFDPADEIGVCAPLGFFDPLGFAPKNKRKNFKNLRAMEIKHGRIAMLATVGSVFQHFIHRPDLPAPWQTYIGTVNPVGIGALAIYYGPVGFIQLSLVEKSLRRRTEELNNGRMAMISIVGIWAAELVTKKDAVEQLIDEGSSVLRPCGPLRLSHRDASQDLQQMLQVKDENLKRKAENPEAWDIDASYICTECEDALCSRCSAQIHRVGARQNHTLFGLRKAAYSKRLFADNLDRLMGILQRNIERSYNLSPWFIFYDQALAPSWYNFTSYQMVRADPNNLVNPPIEEVEGIPKKADDQVLRGLPGATILKDTHVAQLTAQGACFDVPPPVHVKFAATASSCRWTCGMQVTKFVVLLCAQQLVISAGGPCPERHAVIAFFAGEVEKAETKVPCSPALAECYFAGTVHSGPDGGGHYFIDWEDGNENFRRVHHSQVWLLENGQVCDEQQDQQQDEWVPISPTVRRKCTLLLRLHWEAWDPTWSAEGIQAVARDLQAEEVIDGFDWHVIMRFKTRMMCRSAFQRMEKLLNTCNETDLELCRVHPYVKAVELLREMP